MATRDDVRGIALELPETSETTSREGQTAWNVREKGFVWERPLRRADFAALGDTAPDGPILRARVADEGVKQAFLADEPEVYLTTPHFDGFPAVLVRLDEIAVADLKEVVIEAWLDRAPKRLATGVLGRARS